ncbi:hypothetical protein Hanom_Chr08g00723711 [Helianthus anomalus]
MGRAQILVRSATVRASVQQVQDFDLIRVWFGLQTQVRFKTCFGLGSETDQQVNHSQTVQWVRVWFSRFRLGTVKAGQKWSRLGWLWSMTSDSAWFSVQVRFRV